jgi:hydroxymethylbilane synthase
MKRIRIGTRGSELALWQANEVQHRLRKAGYATEIVTIRTTGDREQNVPLATVGGKGLFIKELEEALDAGSIDLAVHSLKDVPSIIPPRFTLAGFLERGDPRDAWLHRHQIAISNLKDGSIVGTSSPRRHRQLASRYPSLKITTMRGNVETRIRKMYGRQVDGLILAAAGLQRLGLERLVTHYLSIDDMVPAAGQGIVAVEIRDGDGNAYDAARSINHDRTETAALTERAVLQRFDTRLDCYSPIAVHATIGTRGITIRAFFDPIVTRREGTDADALIAAVYADLTQNGERVA